MKRWFGCYEGSWKGVIGPAAFAHPAKFSKALVERILDYMLEQGWIEKGEIIGDPFGGVGCGGIVAAYRGFQWYGRELEPKFVVLGISNFRMHYAKWDRLGVPFPVMDCGDSRKFDEGFNAAARQHDRLSGVVASPPYVSGGHHTDALEGGNRNGRGMQTKAIVTSPPYSGSLDDGGPETAHPDGYERTNNWTGYGKTEGQIGRLKAGEVQDAFKCEKCGASLGWCEPAICDKCRTVEVIPGFHEKVDAVVSSPPYAQSIKGQYDDPERQDGLPEEVKSKLSKTDRGGRLYGKTEGQIAELKEGQVDAVVSSPPFTGGRSGRGIVIDGHNDETRPSSKDIGKRTFQGSGAEREPDNIEVLTTGKVAAVLTSPPYEVIHAGAGGLNTKPAKWGAFCNGKLCCSGTEREMRNKVDNEDRITRVKVGHPYFSGPRLSWEAKPIQQSGRRAGASQTTDTQYGAAEGQIARAQKGDVAAVLTSPPYEDSMNQAEHGIDFSKAKPDYPGRKNHPERVKMHTKSHAERRYGLTRGQIGASKGETYWQAMKQVYEACYRALKPGGVMAIVVKDYVKDKKRVRLCDDTMKLLVHIGFIELERVAAMLVQETEHEDMFAGTVTTRKERKSFWRRLAEGKGSPRIDYEEVLFVRKAI